MMLGFSMQQRNARAARIPSLGRMPNRLVSHNVKVHAAMAEPAVASTSAQDESGKVNRAQVRTTPLQ